MKVSEFVQKITDAIHSNLNTDSHINSIYELESAITIFNLQTLLESMHASTEKITKESWQPFIKFLAERWQRIMNTDAIEQYSDTPANRVCHLMAHSLARELKTNAALLLMPSLNAAAFTPLKKGKRAGISKMKPHEYVLSDDNRYTINVCACLEAIASYKDGKLRHTARGVKEILSESEMSRVINHSAETKAYYEKYQTITAAEFAAEKAAFHASFKRDDYKVNPAYGEMGAERLYDMLYRNIDSLTDLVDTLLSLPTSLWKPYCTFYKKANFLDIVLGVHQNMESLLNSDHLISDDENKNRATLFALLEYYYKDREGKSYYGDYCSGFFTGQHKGNKLPPVEKIQEMLTDNLSLSEVAARLNAADSEINQQYKKSLGNGTLSKLKDLISQFSSPEVPLENAARM